MARLRTGARQSAWLTVEAVVVSPQTTRSGTAFRVEVHRDGRTATLAVFESRPGEHPEAARRQAEAYAIRTARCIGGRVRSTTGV